MLHEHLNDLLQLLRIFQSLLPAQATHVGRRTEDLVCRGAVHYGVRTCVTQATGLELLKLIKRDLVAAVADEVVDSRGRFVCDIDLLVHSVPFLPQYSRNPLPLGMTA